MDRLLRGTSGPITVTLTRDGTPENPVPDSALVRILRSDGTELQPQTAGVDTGTGTFELILTPAQTAALDVLTVEWTVTFDGFEQTITNHVEIVGGFLFTIAEARRLVPLDNATKYPTDRIVGTRTAVEQALEDECGVAFVPRYRRETVDGTGGTSLLLRPRVTAIRSASVGDMALTAGALADLIVMESGLVYGYSWTAGCGNVIIGYEHGWTSPPERIKRAALLLARSWLVAGPVDDRAATFSSAEGGTYGLVVPGRGGSIFGLPEVDSTVQQYSLRAGVA